MSPTVVVQLIQALGLSTAAGLNAWLTLFIVSVASHFQIITLGEPFQVMGDTRVMIVLGIMVLIEGLADKVPGFDHASHLVHTVIQPVAGALLFASQAGIVTESVPWFAVLVGGLVAGTVHGTRAVVRVPVTATTAGMGNWLVSLTEDFLAAVISLTALLVPWIAAILLLVMAVLIFRLVRWSRRKIGSKVRNPANRPSSSGVNM